MEKKQIKYLAVLALILVVVLPILASLVFEKLFWAVYVIGLSVTDDGPEYFVTCSEYDSELSTGAEIKEKWVISDNITRYDDLPETQKENFSNKTVEAFKQVPFAFKATDYAEMSDDQKEIFREAINGSNVDIDNRSKTPERRVVYRGKVYTCDADRHHGGA